MPVRTKRNYSKFGRRLASIKLVGLLIMAAIIWHLTSTEGQAAPAEGNLFFSVYLEPAHLFQQRPHPVALEAGPPLIRPLVMTATLESAVEAGAAGSVCPPPIDAGMLSPQRLLATAFLKTASGLMGVLWPKPALAERVNILLLGSDNRPGEKYGHADTMILVTIDPVSKTAGMLSIPRDLWVTIPGYGENRLNMAYRLGEVKGHPGGGPALAMETIRANLGVPVDHYILVDFDGFKQIVDTLGGIDVCVPEKIDAATYYGYHPEAVNKAAHYSYVPAPPDEIEETVGPVEATQPATLPPGHDPAHSNGYKFLYIEAGWHTLDGYTALRYARSRASITADFARVQRQQAVLLAIRDKALQIGIIPKIPELWETMNHIVETDLQLADIVPLSQLAYDIPLANIQTAAIGPEQTVDYTTSSGARVLLPRWPEINLLVDDMFGPSEPALVANQTEIEPGLSGAANNVASVSHIQLKAKAR